MSVSVSVSDTDSDSDSDSDTDTDTDTETETDTDTDADPAQGLPQDTGVATTSNPLPPVCRNATTPAPVSVTAA